MCLMAAWEPAATAAPLQLLQLQLQCLTLTHRRISMCVARKPPLTGQKARVCDEIRRELERSHHHARTAPPQEDGPTCGMMSRLHAVLQAQDDDEDAAEGGLQELNAVVQRVIDAKAAKQQQKQQDILTELQSQLSSQVGAIGAQTCFRRFGSPDLSR